MSFIWSQIGYQDLKTEEFFLPSGYGVCVWSVGWSFFMELLRIKCVWRRARTPWVVSSCTWFGCGTRDVSRWWFFCISNCCPDQSLSCGSSSFLRCHCLTIIVKWNLITNYVTWLGVQIYLSIRVDLDMRLRNHSDYMIKVTFPTEVANIMHENKMKIS